MMASLVCRCDGHRSQAHRGDRFLKAVDGDLGKQNVTDDGGGIDGNQGKRIVAAAQLVDQFGFPVVTQFACPERIDDQLRNSGMIDCLFFADVNHSEFVERALGHLHL